MAPLRVIARVRPSLTGSGDAAVRVLDERSLEVAQTEKNQLVRGEKRGEAPRMTTFVSTQRFDVDGVHGCGTSTRDIYVEEVSPLVHSVIHGGRACVFAYGQTGSGKTFTMTGSPPAGIPGFLHFAAVELIDAVSRANAAAGPSTPLLQVHVTGCEVYQETLLDLAPDAHKAKRLSATTLCRVPVETSSTEGLVAALEGLVARRATGATNKNEHSSRSHAVYTVVIERAALEAPPSSSHWHDDEEPAYEGAAARTFCGSFSLVDLAGAEFAAATEGREDVRRLEGSKSNLGLMTLKAAFRHIAATTIAAATGAPPPFPFSWSRSKLTIALRDHFTDPRAQLLMLITASPEKVDACQSAQALEEGVMVAGRSCAPRVVVELAPPPPAPRAPAPIKRGLGGGGGGAPPPSARAVGAPQQAPPRAPLQPLRAPGRPSLGSGAPRGGPSCGGGGGGGSAGGSRSSSVGSVGSGGSAPAHRSSSAGSGGSVPRVGGLGGPVPSRNVAAVGGVRR